MRSTPADSRGFGPWHGLDERLNESEESSNRSAAYCVGI